MLQEQLQNGSTKTINGHECVDLGLSVCWATCNIGASLPKQCGGFFAWGETSSKNTFSEENYTYYSGTEERFGSQKKVIQGGDITSGKHDAAAVIWGGGWRMPTLKEWEELLKKCECKESSEGWEIVAGNQQSIFIPKVPAGNPPYDFTRYWTGNNVYTFERFVEDQYSGALAVSFKMPLSSANQKVWRGWPIRPVIDKSLFGEAIPQPAAQKEEPKKADAKKEASSTNLMIENMATEFENELGTFYPKNDWSDLELIKGAEGLLSDDYEGTFSGQVDYALVDQDEETETDDSAYNLSRAIKNIYMNLDDPDEWPLDSKSMRYNAGNTTKGIWVFGTDKYGSMDDGTVLVFTNEKGAFAILKVENVEAIGDWCF